MNHFSDTIKDEYMKQKTRILYLIPSLRIGGAERVCLNLADNLDYNAFEVNIISLSEEMPLIKLFKNKDKIAIYSCREPHNLGFPWISFSGLYRFYKLVNQINPQVVHSHLWGRHCIYLYLFLFKRGKISFVSTIHSSEFIYISTKPIYKLFRWVESFAYKILNFRLIVISEAVKKTTIKTLSFKEIIQIENGIDTDYFKPEQRIKYTGFKDRLYKNKFPILIHAGRNGEAKRQVDIIKAIPFLRKSYPNLRVILIGRDNKINNLDLIRKLEVEEFIEFIEYSDDPLKFLSIADIAVFPSLYEGLSLSLMEMMSCGLPLIVTNVASLTEMTNGSEAAMVVPTKSPEEIAKKVALLASNRNLCQEIGSKARNVAVQRYSKKRMIVKHEELYKRINVEN